MTPARGWRRRSDCWPRSRRGKPGRRYRRPTISAAVALSASRTGRRFPAMSMPCCAIAPRSTGGSRARATARTVDARTRLFAALLLIEGWAPAEVAQACDGDRFRPAPLDQRERRLIATLSGRTLDHPDMPAPGAATIRTGSSRTCTPRCGRDLAREMAALQGGRRSIFGSISSRATARPRARRWGARACRPRPRRFRRWACGCSSAFRWGRSNRFRGGLVEVQDEGSQLAALLADARPGMRVVDFCAGAGGKTLALAAAHGEPRPARRLRHRRRGGSSAPASACAAPAPAMSSAAACLDAATSGSGATPAASTGCWSTRPAPASAPGGAIPTPNGA